MGGAKRIMHKNVTQSGHLARQRFIILLLALVDAAVFKQHQLASLHVNTIDPVGHHGNSEAHQFPHALGHRSQRVFGLEVTLGRTSQMRGNHDGSTSVQRHQDAGHAGPDAGVLGDVAGVVLRHIQVRADEDALAGDFATGAQVGETDEVHGETSW